MVVGAADRVGASSRGRHICKKLPSRHAHHGEVLPHGLEESYRRGPARGGHQLGEVRELESFAVHFRSKQHRWIC